MSSRSSLHRTEDIPPQHAPQPHPLPPTSQLHAFLPGRPGALSSWPSLTGRSLPHLESPCWDHTLGFQNTSCLTLPWGPHQNSPRSPRLPRSWETKMCLESPMAEKGTGRERLRMNLCDHCWPGESAGPELGLCLCNPPPHPNPALLLPGGPLISVFSDFEFCLLQESPLGFQQI